MTVNPPDPFTVTTARSRKLLLDITELIEAFNTELEIIEANLPTPASGRSQEEQQGGNQEDRRRTTDTVPFFSVGDRVRITNRVLATFPLLSSRQSSVDGPRALNVGVIVRITTSRIHIKLDGHPSRIVQRHPSNVALLT